ncbi:unnamed protein product [Cuscuta campestris]|uniref:Uncharacterized protein n=1 Tax=Cuscuta campestris TaxID=132261 RepID=A0A484NKW9_9ASTE|nr:unnamed protein product [Cuscuta campestris]
MASEGFDDDDLWSDADFVGAVAEAVEAVELASTQRNLLPPPTHPHPPPAATPSHFVGISSSPPWKASQLVVPQVAAPSTSKDSNGVFQQQEIDRLKGELGRVSELLAQKEQECIMLRKHSEEKETNAVQTERASVSTISTGESDSPSMIKKKLLDAWESPTGQNLGRIFVSKLLETCEADFRVLFGLLDSSFPSKMRTESSFSNSGVAKEDNLLQDHLNVSAKVSHLYSVLTKISNEMIRLDGLLDALVELCQLKNVVIMYRALHILHEVLSCSFFAEKKDDRRSNVIFEEIDENRPSRRGSHSKEILNHNAVDRLDNSDALSRMGSFNPGTSVFTSCFNYLSLFELMCQIIMMNGLEHIRWEAVSIMNLILVRKHTFLEREKFGSDIVFQSVSLLLRKDVGYRVNKQAVRLLYLLLNCKCMYCFLEKRFLLDVTPCVPLLFFLYGLLCLIEVIFNSFY